MSLAALPAPYRLEQENVISRYPNGLAKLVSDKVAGGDIPHDAALVALPAISKLR